MPDDLGEFQDEILHRIWERAVEDGVEGAVCECFPCRVEAATVYEEVPQGFRKGSERRVIFRPMPKKTTLWGFLKFLWDPRKYPLNDAPFDR